MNSVQYEELCRFFLASTLGIPVSAVTSVNIPNPKRTGLPQYKHQIDLYWETEDELCRYLNIANAKWRNNYKVDQPEVLLLQQVKEKVAAHKAVILTNTGFTAGAVAAAKDEGIALHIITPSLNAPALNTKDRALIQSELLAASSRHAAPIYNYEVVHRAFDFGKSQPSEPVTASTRVAAQTSTKVITGGVNRVAGGVSNRAVSSGGRRPGDGPMNRGPGGFQKK